jgi:CRISPR system Cascade subunit CasC
MEQHGVDELVGKLIAEQRAPEAEELELLRHEETAADIALFGRMLASKPVFNTEAACQVAHAISVHPVVIEDDYFTAVDDLNDHSEDAGAAHIGETGFAAGLFYSYICINKSLLVDNLNGDEALANRAIKALTEAATKVAPEGKQNSFGSRAYASYVLAEKGEQQPRSLSVAFLKPIDQRQSDDFASDAIAALTDQQQKFDQVYGECADARYALNAVVGDGKLAELLDFVSA